MKFIKPISLLLAAVLTLPAACASIPAAEDAVAIQLSDAAVTVDGAPASTDPAAAVYVGADVVYYHDGTDETYGEGADAEKHSAQDAAAHTVVTVTQPGTYRLSGTLTQGQIAVDLGEDAVDDPSAVVTLILDGADVTCTVAPALIFYNVYECDRAWVSYDDGENPDYKATADVDTSAAGANIILADGSENTFTGSHVARIYQEGTTKKLHKYDGAFYSKMSMNIDGDSGVLNITADNEGLDSELHLTVNGGRINIEAQNDGINTNEDNVSVTTVNGGYLTIDAGSGTEGDGIDSNGYLVINGGVVWTTANPAADGGIDAESPILINGGNLSAFGGRNDAADAASAQPYMELSFAASLPAGSVVELREENGQVVWGAETTRPCQSITLSTEDLALNVPYNLYVNDVLQCWSGNGFGMMGGRGGMGGQRPEGFDGQRPQDFSGSRPDSQAPDGQTPPMTGEDAPRPFDQEGELPQRPGRKDFDGQEPPEGFDPSQSGHGGFGGDRVQADGSGSTEFTLTESVKSFSGVCDSDLPFTDVSADDPGRSAIQALYKAGAMNGTGDRHFSPDMTLTRAQAITVLARLAGAEAVESDAFSDVAAGSWYAGYVGWAVDNGIVQGDGAGHFYPDLTVTADQMALMLSRYRSDYQNATDFEGALTRSQLAQMAAVLLP